MEGMGAGAARCEAPVDYEILDHTADLGIQVRGRDMAEILARAGMALADLEYDPMSVERLIRREIHLEEAERESLLVRWLNELIVLREVADFLWREVDLELDSHGRLRAILVGERFDESRHRPRMGLKAATYHFLQVRQEGDGLLARFIFDV